MDPEAAKLSSLGYVGAARVRPGACQPLEGEPRTPREHPLAY